MKKHTSSLIQNKEHLMKNNIPIFPAHLCIPSHITLIDDYIGGFKSHALTYLYGTSSLLHHFPYHLCINTYAMFQGTSVFIDGGCSINPYLLSSYAKRYEIAPWDALRSVHVSRAFTMHQFHSIVQDSLESLIQTYHPNTVILHAFPFLYQDNDVSFHESSTLFKETLTTIQRLTGQYDLITVITNPIRQPNHALDDLHYSLSTTCDELICIQHMKHCPRICLPRYHAEATVIKGTKGQLCLQDFGVVI